MFIFETACSFETSNGVEKIHRNGRRWQAFFLEPNLTPSHKGPNARKLSDQTLRESRYARSGSREPECSASLSWPPPNQFLRSPDQGPVEDNDIPSVAVCAVQIIKVFFDQRTSNQVINTICLHCQWTKVVRSRKNEDLAS